MQGLWRLLSNDGRSRGVLDWWSMGVMARYTETGACAMLFRPLRRDHLIRMLTLTPLSIPIPLAYFSLQLPHMGSRAWPKIYLVLHGAG